MLVPMIVIAAFCVLFGVYNALPVNHLATDHAARRVPSRFAGMQLHLALAGLAVLALAAALVHHLLGAKAHGSGLHAVDHIRNAPGAVQRLRRRREAILRPVRPGNETARRDRGRRLGLDRGLDWFYDRLVVGAARGFGWSIRAVHTGNASLYVALGARRRGGRHRVRRLVRLRTELSVLSVA